MKFEEYRKHDATSLAGLVKNKEVTPSELLDIAIARTEQVNPRLNAVVAGLYDLARKQIGKLDLNAPFAGVPFLIKDLDVELQGTPFTAGTRLLKNYISDESSETANRILKGGLVIFGKTNTPEFGLTPYTEGELLGVCRNPWNTDYTTGGSSGGSGAAVAAGIVPMAFAGDGGGSIRIPASCNGLFGIKPSRGRISNGPLYGEVWSGAVTSGIISRSVRDAAAYLDLVQGEVPGDPYIIQKPERPYAEEVAMPVRKLKIGYTTEHPITRQDEENIKAVEATVKLLHELGHSTEEVKLPFKKELLTQIFYVMVCAELSATLDHVGHIRGKKPGRAEVEANTWLLYKLGKSFTANDAAKAKMQWNSINRTMGIFHQQYDMLLTPTLCPSLQLLGQTLW